jgi:hypothetical protein
VSDGPATWQFLLCPVLIYMDPLLVAGRRRKKIDTILGDLNPFAHSNLGANRSLELAEVTEDAHAESLRVHLSLVRSSFQECWSG